MPATLTNYPLGFTGTYTYLKTVANGGLVTNSSGFDIAFFSDAALTTQLPCEQVFYSATTGAVEFWIGMSSFSNSSVIYLAYGNPSVSTAQCTNASNTVWDSNFKIVFHFPNGSTLSANDSSGNGNNGTINSVVAIAGAWDGAADFGTSNNGHHIDTSFIMPTTNFTFSQWINSSGNGVTNRPFGAANFTGGTYGTGLIWNFSTTPASVYAIFRQGTNTGVGDVQYNYGGSFLGTHYVAVTMDSTAGGKIFMDGAHAATNATYTSITTGGAHVWIGRDQNQNSSAYQGWVDEVRVSDVVRSDNWLTTEFHNQAPGTFFTIGGQLSLGTNIFPVIY